MQNATEVENDVDILILPIFDNCLIQRFAPGKEIENSRWTKDEFIFDSINISMKNSFTSFEIAWISNEKIDLKTSIE